MAAVAGTGNQLFRVRGGAFDLAVRIPARRRFVPVAAEYHNQCIAAAAALAPACRFHDPDSGAIAVDWIAGARPSATRDPATLSRLAGLLSRLHATPTPFADRIDPRRAVRWEFAAIRDRALEAAARQAVARIAELSPIAAVNCHGDPLPENVVECGDSTMLLDFEYSHRGHPAWDLAVLANALELDRDDSKTLLASYRRRAEANVDAASLAAYRELLTALTTAWELENRATVSRAPG